MEQMHDNAPRISVVIPYYNREHTLLRALDSVRDQTEQDFEIIAVDDGSTDGSYALVEAYRQRHPGLRLRNIRQENGGPSAARNNGVRHAVGEFVAFLDSDDSWAPDKLRIQHGFMEAHPEVMMTGTDYAVRLEGGPPEPGYRQRAPYVQAHYRKMLFKVFFCMPTVMVRRRVFTDSGIWFREGKHHAEDLLFFLQVISRHSGGRLRDVLTYVHKEMYGKEGLTADLNAMLRNDMDNIRILRRERDSRGKQLSVGFAGILACYTLLKHMKRVIRSELQ